MSEPNAPLAVTDTHALIWFLAEAPMEEDALVAIAEAQVGNTLFVSPISA